MKCTEIRELMSGYLDNQLSEHEAKALRAHLSGCEECRNDLFELEKSLQVIRDLPPQEPVLDLWPEFALRFAEAGDPEPAKPAGRFRSYFAQIFSGVRKGWRIFVAVLRYRMRPGDAPQPSG